MTSPRQVPIGISGDDEYYRCSRCGAEHNFTLGCPNCSDLSEPGIPGIPAISRPYLCPVCQAEHTDQRTTCPPPGVFIHVSDCGEQCPTQPDGSENQPHCGCWCHLMPFIAALPLSAPPEPEHWPDCDEHCPGLGYDSAGMLDWDCRCWCHAPEPSACAEHPSGCPARPHE